MARAPTNGPTGREAIEEIDRRLGGLLGGLTEGLARIADAAEQAEAASGAREATIDTGKGPMRVGEAAALTLAPPPPEAETARLVLASPARPTAEAAAAALAETPLAAGDHVTLHLADIRRLAARVAEIAPDRWRGSGPRPASRWTRRGRRGPIRASAGSPSRSPCSTDCRRAGGWW